ncbi:hypothetical protein [Haloarchaeobius salinus]|uniref:hypothetical protein n=1 Tax=Haloarchaeobius salinus TaxID=1198298 RepID=UPI00210E2BCF|nr:hypothetical protein [Haloarchaeobius salinus]
MNRPSRRRLLAATGAAAASFSIAGCSSNSGDGDSTPTGTTAPTTDGNATDEPTTGNGDTTGTGEAVDVDQLRRWVPASDAFEFEIPATVLYDADFEAIGERTDDFYQGTYDQIAQTLMGPNLASIVPAEDRVRTVQVASAATVLLQTSMGADELGSALTEAGLSESGPEGDATLYEGTLNGSQTTTAVVGSVVVQAFGENASGTVSAVLDARSGEVARALDEDEAVAAIVDGIGDSDLLVASGRGDDTPAGDPSLDGATALGYGWEFGADDSDLTLAVAYADGESGDPAAVASYFGEQSGFGDYDGIEGSAEGDLVLVTGTIATDEFDLLSPGTPGESSGSEAPRVQFAFEFGDGTMTVTHEGGDTVQASALGVRVGDSQAESQFADEYEEVSAGDSLTVDVSGVESGTQVLVVWTDGQNGAILAQTQVP